MAIARITRLRILEGENKTFEAIHEKYTRLVEAKEPDILLYRMSRSRTDPSEFVIYEEYPDEATMVAHGRTVHFNNDWTKLGLFIDGNPETIVTDVLSANEASQ